ncbi:MAG TPA: hypothetical protein VF980_11605 [Thermoanaerobaculia bacterium]
MVATDAGVAPEEKRATAPALETWATNELMRHVPPVDWMVRKVEADLRKRIAKLTSVFANLPFADPRHPAVESEFRILCKAIERLSDAARPSRRSAQQGDLPTLIDSLLTQAATNLRSLEQTAFGRRGPFHLFDRSKSEPVYAALLAVIAHTERIVPLVRSIDPTIDERLLEGLVVLSDPVDDRVLTPIA